MFCPKCGIENPDNSKFCRNCGGNLTNVLAAANGEILSENIAVIDSKPDEVYSTGIRNIVLGFGFMLVGFLLFTMPGNTIFWLLALIPGFSLLAFGISQTIKGEALKKERKLRKNVVQPSLLPRQEIKSLPESNNEYISPNSRFKTKDLIVPSVTEETTQQLSVEK